MAASALGCLHWREVPQLLGGAAIVLLYGEELYRCVTKADRTLY